MNTHCMTAPVARGRPCGEMEAERRFNARIGFAWRHFCRDAPAASASRFSPMEKLLGPKLAKQRAVKAPPGLEQIFEVPQLAEREAINQMPKEEAQDVRKQVERLTLLGLDLLKSMDYVRSSMDRVEKGMETNDTDKDRVQEDNQHGGSPQAQAMFQEPCNTKEPNRSDNLDEAGAWDAAEQGRKLKAHCSDESTSASCADTEEWEPHPLGPSPHRPRCGRRAKARARRELWEEAKQQSFREAMHESGGWAGSDNNVIGALLSCIDEDGLETDFCRMSEDDDSKVCDSPTPHDQSEDDQPQTKRIRANEMEPNAAEQDNPDVDPSTSCRQAPPDSDSEHEDGSDESSWSEAEGDGDADMVGHVRLEDLDKGVAALPACLVRSLVNVQEAADKWQAEDETGEPTATKESFALGLKEMRHKLKRVKWVVRHLGTSWDCPQFMSSQWREFKEWLLEEEEAGVCYHIQKIDELIEDAADKEEDEEADEKWMGYELCFRCCSVQNSWEQVVEYIASIETAIARRDYIEKRRAAEDSSLQSAMNDRLTKSLEHSHLSS